MKIETFVSRLRLLKKPYTAEALAEKLNRSYSSAIRVIRKLRVYDLIDGKVGSLRCGKGKHAVIYQINPRGLKLLELLNGGSR